MRVLESLTYYLPNISGLTYHAQIVAKGLSGRGHQVTVLCLQHDPNLPPTEVIDNISVIRAKPFMGLSKGFLSWQWLLLVLKLVPNQDVILIHLPQFEAAPLALYAKLRHKKVIVFYHCDLVLPPSLTSTLIEFFLNLSHRLTLSLADVIMQSTADYALHSPLLSRFATKLTYCLPPIPIRSTTTQSLRALTQKIGHKETYAIGFVGRLAAEKGIEYFLEALPQITKELLPATVGLYLVGPQTIVGEFDYLSKIKQLINASSTKIHQLGILPDNQLAAFYRFINVLVLPSVNATESFGTVQAEAMLAGTPVVVSDLPGVRVPIQKTGMGLIVPPRDSSRIAKAIVKIIRDQESFAKNSSLQLVKHLFNQDQIINTYDRLVTN